MPRIHGFDPAQWEKMVSAGHSYLAEVARRSETTSHLQFVSQIFVRAGFPTAPKKSVHGGVLAEAVLPDDALVELLTEVARRSGEAKSVILPAVLSVSDDEHQGNWFFAYAQEIGLLDKKAKREAKFVFGAEHLKKVFAAYAAR